MLDALRRAGLWRLTRNDAGRTLYELLDCAGISFAALLRYRASADAGDTVEPSANADADVRFTTLSDRDRPLPARLADARSDADVVPCAVIEDTVVGYCLLSDRPVTVPEIDATIDPDGAYLWRLYVDPDFRGRGIGTRLIEHARGVAAGRYGVPAVVAFVAVDNLPSRRAFERAGFAATEQLYYAGLFGRGVRRERPVSGRLRS